VSTIAPRQAAHGAVPTGVTASTTLNVGTSRGVGRAEERDTWSVGDGVEYGM